MDESSEFNLKRNYYTVDEQGSTTLITDKNQQIKNEYYYDAFGCVLEAQEKVHNRLTYTGQQFDGITGQYYLRARFYNRVIGKFTPNGHANMPGQNYGQGNLLGTGPGKRRAGESIDLSRNVVPFYSPDAHWPRK